MKLGTAIPVRYRGTCNGQRPCCTMRRFSHEWIFRTLATRTVADSSSRRSFRLELARCGTAVPWDLTRQRSLGPHVHRAKVAVVLSHSSRSVTQSRTVPVPVTVGSTEVVGWQSEWAQPPGRRGWRTRRVRGLGASSESGARFACPGGPVSCATHCQLSVGARGRRALDKVGRAGS